MKNTLPLVSIIVPSYNHEKYVVKTIESIVNQTYKNIELIVFDDGSKDKSPAILNELSRKYNFYFKAQENIGLPATLNRMIKMSSGKYLSIIASDDVIMPNKIDLLVREFEHLSSDYAVVCGNANFINESGEHIFYEAHGNQYREFLDLNTRLRKDFDHKKHFGEYPTLLEGNYIPAMSTLIKKDSLLEVGLYDENINVEDWDMWLKLAKKFKIKYIDNIVASYRRHATNTIVANRENLRVDIFKTIEKQRDYCFANNLSELWQRRLNDSIFEFLIERRYSVFYTVINKNNFFSFCKFFGKKILKRLGQKQ